MSITHLFLGEFHLFGHNLGTCMLRANPLDKPLAKEIATNTNYVFKTWAFEQKDSC